MSDTPISLKSKLSTTPSWIMVGFVIGALFAFGVDRELDRRNQTKSPATPMPPASVPAKVEPQKSSSALKDRTSLSAIENIFAQYDSHAIWRNDLTEIALWNAETNKFSECFEVMRSGEYYYYRTIPSLTRPVLRPNPAPELPLRYTEPEDEQLKRLQQQPAWLPPSTEPDR